MGQDAGSNISADQDRALRFVTYTSMAAMLAVVSISGYAINRVGNVGTTLGVENAQVGTILAGRAFHAPSPDVTLAGDIQPEVVYVQQAPPPSPAAAPAPTAAFQQPTAAFQQPPVASSQFPAAAPYPQPQPAPAAYPTPVPNPAEILENPAVVEQLLLTISLAAGIDAPGEATGEFPIFAFFDPRCPFCHQAFLALDGKVSVRWLPTLALGNEAQGAPIVAGIVGATEAAMDGGEIASVALPEDPERLTRLAAAMAGERVAPGEATEAHRFMLDENLDLALQLAPLSGGEPFGVPTFIVPRPNGTMAFIRGWDKERTFDAILEEYTGGA